MADPAELKKLIIAELTKRRIGISRYELSPRPPHDGADPSIYDRFKFFQGVEKLQYAKPGQHARTMIAVIDTRSGEVWFRSEDAFAAFIKGVGFPANIDRLSAATALSIWYELTRGQKVELAMNGDGAISEEIAALIGPPTMTKRAPDGTVVIEGWTHTAKWSYRNKTLHSISISREGVVRAVSKPSPAVLRERSKSK